MMFVTPESITGVGNVVSAGETTQKALEKYPVGGIVYFAIYQLGVIAGISGLIIFLLANLGYRLFARTKNKNSIVALVVSIVLMIIVIFLAECFCVSFDVLISSTAPSVMPSGNNLTGIFKNSVLG